MASRAAAARLVLVTASSEEEAASIGRTLVEERLAACTNLIGPIRSIYRWQGNVEDEREYLLVIKTRAELYPKIEKRVRELHSYQTPEVISVQILDGSAPYLAWLLESTADL
ncbi:MAG: divalent-cation tolerance protein CutA [Candidatus Binataceae bacterium]